MRTVGYVQGSDVSARSQTAAISREAKRLGTPVSIIYIDAEPATINSERTELRKLLQLAKRRQIRSIILLDHLRFGTEAYGAAALEYEFERFGVRLVFCRTKRPRNYAAAREAVERVDLWKRWAAGKTSARRAGRPKYGSKPEETAAVELARRLRAKGKTYKEIGEALLKAGHKPRTARIWYQAQIRRMVSGER